MHILPAFLGCIVKPVVFDEIIDPGKDDDRFGAHDEDDSHKVG